MSEKEKYWNATHKKVMSYYNRYLNNDILFEQYLYHAEALLRSFLLKFPNDDICKTSLANILQKKIKVKNYSLYTKKLIYQELISLINLPQFHNELALIEKQIKK